MQLNRGMQQNRDSRKLEHETRINGKRSIYESKDLSSFLFRPGGPNKNSRKIVSSTRPDNAWPRNVHVITIPVASDLNALDYIKTRSIISLLQSIHDCLLSTPTCPSTSISIDRRPAISVMDFNDIDHTPC